jgi:hypothetical protein
MVENGCEAGHVVDRGEVVIDVDKEEDDDGVVNADEVKADRLYEIAKCEKLSLLLKDWEKQFKVARERLETKTTRTNSAKNDLYQWIGFFSVFQGVVLTAVAQSSTLGCQQSWAPASLSLIASVVTIVSVHFKLKSYRALEVNLANETYDSKVRTFPVYIYIYIYLYTYIEFGCFFCMLFFRNELSFSKFSKAIWLMEHAGVQ